MCCCTGILPELFELGQKGVVRTTSNFKHMEFPKECTSNGYLSQMLIIKIIE